MTEPNDLTALAAACERAADDLRYSPRWPEATMYEAELLRHHARAIRAGRVTVRPEAPRVTHCCGAQGFGREPTDRCPACEQEGRVTANEGGSDD